ncbi:GDNF family receptor alpha-4-like [Ambystoma mexicanum]|uniref:GDNF family receptor alpha-4-like n=1 Tax=Ambystoma mexicanum TaxID=8296 RepID=UPI0037E9114B
MTRRTGALQLILTSQKMRPLGVQYSGPLRVQVPGALGMQFLRALVALSLSGASLAAVASLQTDCIDAERLCLQQAPCTASYHLLGQCSPGAANSHELGQQCLEAKRMLHRSPLGICKCQRRMRSENQCLRIYWALRPVFAAGFLGLEDSPYEDAETELPGTTDFSHLAALISDSLDSGNNLCLDMANVCLANRRCRRHRNEYVSACSADNTGGACNQRKCHRELRYFFEKVPEDFTRRMLFCPCQDAQCGERRRNTIVPQCSHEEPVQRNCLLLMDSCQRDHVCRSRLAHFQNHCQHLGRAAAACAQDHRAACLQSYMGLIGTTLTPNYISNSSLDISIWCTCEGSGNHLEECNAILNLFTSNTCLQAAIKAQMGLNEVLPHALSTSGTFQRDRNENSHTPETDQTVEVDTGEFAELQEASTKGPRGSSNNTAPCTPFPFLWLTLLLCLLPLMPQAHP